MAKSLSDRLGLGRRGVAAADLSHTDIAVYWPIVHRQWPSLELAAVKKVANVGRMLCAFDAITGEAEPRNVMRKMMFYRAEISMACAPQDCSCRRDMEKLLPDVLKELWQTVEEEHLDDQQFYAEKERLLEEYRRRWSRALILDGRRELKDSLLRELGSYLGNTDFEEIERRCGISWKGVEDEWHQKVGNGQSIEFFYDDTEAYLYNLIWWHTLIEDDTPLAYVTALDFARSRGVKSYLDFGSGISSGPILFARYGMDVASADISSSLLAFSAWRFQKRDLHARLIDLKHQSLPHNTFALVTAMDVFEHLTDPAGAVDEIWATLTPGGFLYGLFACESDDERPQHIVHDFEPVFRRLRDRGFVRVWEDEWLWGHQVFQKT